MDTSPEPKKLPSNPSLEHLQKQAKKLVKQNPSLQLAAAQHRIAQEYGFKNWAELAKAVEAMAGSSPSSLAETSKSALPDPAAVQAQLDAFLKGTDGGVAAVWVDGSRTLFFQAGTRSKTDPAPVTPDTVFGAGFLANVFTALLLAESERLGKVSLSDPAAKYLLAADDPAQANLKPITLLSLATHTSGLPMPPIKELPMTYEQFAGLDRDKLAAAFRSAGATALPGGPISYSNFGLALLGEALAAAWGAPYAEILSRQVFEPLGMKESAIRFQSAALARGVQTCTRDMAKFLSAALGHGDTPLRSTFAATLRLRPQFASSVFGSFIGLGWMLTNKTEHPVAWHGVMLGSRSFMALDLKTGAAIAILTSANKSPNALGFELLGVKPPNPKVQPIVDAASYIGRYPLGIGQHPSGSMPSIEITEYKGGLRAQGPGLPPGPMRAIGPDRFALGGSTQEISFERDATGKVVALKWSRRGLRQPLPQPPASVELPADTLLEYSGRYAVTPTFIIKVEVDRNELFVQIGERSKLRAFASAKDEFFVTSMNAKIHFRRDEAGQVSGIVVEQKSHNLAGTKCDK
ncbi:MAG TPA: serine hydrolase [Opitutaceae bacterium]|nr:serine hydrolase [Opitutaceae bacterium]